VRSHHELWVSTNTAKVLQKGTPWQCARTNRKTSESRCFAASHCTTSTILLTQSTPYLCPNLRSLFVKWKTKFAGACCPRSRWWCVCATHIRVSPFYFFKESAVTVKLRTVLLAYLNRLVCDVHDFYPRATWLDLLQLCQSLGKVKTVSFGQNLRNTNEWFFFKEIQVICCNGGLWCWISYLLPQLRQASATWSWSCRVWFIGQEEVVGGGRHGRCCHGTCGKCNCLHLNPVSCVSAVQFEEVFKSGSADEESE